MIDTATTTLDLGVDELLETDLSRVPSIEVMELLRSLERLRRRLDAVDHRLVAEVESRRLAGDYARSTTVDLLVTALRVSPGEARARVTQAGDLGPRSSLTGEQLPPPMPATSDAVAVGDIAAAHVAVIAGCLDRLPPAFPPDAVAIVESTLVTAARHEHPGHLRRTAALLLARLDTDGPEPAEAQRRRELSLARNADGMGRFRGRLTPEATAVWYTILDTLSAPVPAADGMPDERSPGQRRHDALLDAGYRLLRSGTLPAAGGMPVTVLIRTTAADLRATGAPVPRPPGRPGWSIARSRAVHPRRRPGPHDAGARPWRRRHDRRRCRRARGRAAPRSDPTPRVLLPTTRPRRPRRRLQLPRLRSSGSLDRGPPRHPVAARWTDRHRQPLPALPVPPPRVRIPRVVGADDDRPSGVDTSAVHDAAQRPVRNITHHPPDLDFDVGRVPVA